MPPQARHAPALQGAGDGLRQRRIELAVTGLAPGQVRGVAELVAEPGIVVDLLDQRAQSGAGGEDDGGGRITGHYRPMVARPAAPGRPGRRRRGYWTGQGRSVQMTLPLESVQQ